MNTNTNYYNVGRVILLLVTLVLVGQTLLAQNPGILKSDSEKQNEKIKMKVKIEKDGQKRSFEKEYNNEKEMNDDPELKALREEMDLGEDGLSGKDSFMPVPPPPPLALGNKMDKDENSLKHYKYFSSDSFASIPLPPEPPSFDEEKWINNWSASDSMTGNVKHIYIYHNKVRGGTDKEDKAKEYSSDIKLLNFNYYPNPNNGLFNLKFDTKKSDPIIIKIFNDEGETIFLDKLERPDEKYEKQIDLRDKKRGVYFLDIEQSGKKIKKKIIVE